MTFTPVLVPRSPFPEPAVIPADELEPRPHDLFRQHRPLAPLIRREDGVYIAIRARDVETLAADPRTRQLETELVFARGVTDGPLYDFFNNSMLLSNGPLHRRRRAPFARVFALELTTTCSLSSAFSRDAVPELQISAQELSNYVRKLTATSGKPPARILP